MTAASWPWRLAVSAFNWTPEIVAAERPADEIVLGIARDGVAALLEIEPGQLWRSFPAPEADEVASLRQGLRRAGASVSIVGLSLDEWRSPSERRDAEQRLAFLVPQLRAARAIGAEGVRLPLGAAGEPLLCRLQPLLAELDLVLYEELQGQQVPQQPAAGAALETIAALDDPRIRVLLDSSAIMPALPVTYLAMLERAGLEPSLLHRLEHDWAACDTHAAVVAALREGRVPPALRGVWMDMLVRFGRARAHDFRDVLGLVGAVHLKFWDLEDADRRVSAPLVELGAALRVAGASGTLCSEWGGHAWLSDDATTMTRRHLALASAALTPER